MRAFGARGFVSPEQLKRSAAVLKKYRRQRQDQQRAEIAALSNKDIQTIMARAAIAAMTARGSVSREDFHQAGIPNHRIDQNFDAAMRQARLQEPKLDAMRGASCAN